MLFNKTKSNDVNDKPKKEVKKNLLQDENQSKIGINEYVDLFDDEDDGDVKTGFSFKRRKTQKIIKDLNKQKVKTLLFYTDINNVLRQLEFGLQPIKNIHLAKDSEYIVWTYLEKSDHFELELDNSSRHYFWSWVAEQKVDPNQIAIIALDLKLLFEATKNDWLYDDITRRVHIFENVKPEAIRWILMKNNQYISRIQNYVKNHKMKIKIFQGEKGNITDLFVENRKK